MELYNKLSKKERIQLIEKAGEKRFTLSFYKYYQIKNKDFIFSHGSKNILPDNKLLVGSYHPSPRNVNTGRINQNKMVKLLNNIKEIL